MYYGTKNDIISAFNEAKQPLDAETKADFDESEKQLKELGLSLEFATLLGKCRICNYEEGVIVPIVADLDNLECRNCGNMTMQEKEELEWLRTPN